MDHPRALPLRHALALGLLHGPAELLPVSSSGHTTLVPWLAAWPYARADGELRKSFEVALHAGTALALLLRPPGARQGGGRAGRGGSLAFLALAVAPPAVAGYALHDRIERRLGTPVTIAAGLIAGSLALAAAEIRARRSGASRTARQAGARDGAALGLAQALALAPGVSRSGAAFAAARTLGFAAPDADRLSWSAGLPVLGGAALLQSAKLARRGMPAGARAPLAAGAASAFLSTLAAVSLLDSRRRARAALPASLHRFALASLVIRRTLARPAAQSVQSKK